MDVLIWMLFGLAALAIPFVVPILAWVYARNTRRRLSALEEQVAGYHVQLEVLVEELRRVRGGVAEPAPAEPAPAAAPRVEPQAGDAAGTPEAEAPSAAELPRHVPEPPAAPEPEPAPAPAAEEVPGIVEPISPPEPAFAPAAREDAAPAEEEAAAFDWESLVGVKLFSVIAGVALVIAAVFFLRYSIESGWLQPPVRVAIGVITAVGLLVLCELKAARRYPVTANALDAAAVAILFATFFAAHALWNLIPGFATFLLLSIVTVLAVVLSIRRESILIAVLGLLGGFATPALLSTGENRPIPLFAYLLLLNVGLAWVAYRNRWPVLTWLTLVLTTAYQWGWVFRYLDRASVPLAMAIFLVFPAASVAALMIGSRRNEDGGAAPGAADARFGSAAALSATVPILFAVFLAAVPEYGARPALLFGFLLLVDAGLLTIAIARREALLHAAGAVGTLVSVAIWMAVSYDTDARHTLVAFTAAFALLFLFAPAVAARVSQPADGLDKVAVTGPLLLFVFPALAALDPAYAAPWPLLLPLLALVVVIAIHAAATRRGSLYFIAAFFAVAAQGVWSARFLEPGRLGTAVLIYVLFGVVALAAPLGARRLGRPLAPAAGGGVVLLASLILLLFLSLGDVAAEALWALALLLAILNAAIFVESAAGALPRLSQAGSLLSWIVLAIWWGRAAAAVGVIPSLMVLTGLSILTLGGHAWAVRRSEGTASAPTPAFRHGLYLGLVGHLFLLLLAANRAWAVPPWPLFASLAAITLASSAASLVAGSAALHAAGTIAAGIVVAVWAFEAGSPPWGLTGLAAAAAVGAYALVWIRLRAGPEARQASLGAAGALLAGTITVQAAVAGGGAPPFAGVLLLQVAQVSGILWLASRFSWRWLPLVAVAPAWTTVLQWHARARFDGEWPQLLALAVALYAPFAAFPMAIGRRAAAAREPYLAAILASAMFFFGARAAFIAADLEWMIGVVPIAAGAVLAILLRHLLRLEPASERDQGRLAMVAGSALAFVTVAIPLQLENQWVTIGWALEGAALAWLYGRVPHRGLLIWSLALLGAVFVRLAMNPEIRLYEPRGALRILNWYLYTYVACAAAMFAAARWLARTDDRLGSGLARASHALPAMAVVLLFLVLNIEIADYYATGPTIAFRFGSTVSQDLTYTIGWLAFGLGLLAAGIYLGSRPARIAALALVAVTTFKCFLYDLGSLGGLYRVASLVGLALSLALVALALQKFVLSRPRGAA